MNIFRKTLPTSGVRRVFLLSTIFAALTGLLVPGVQASTVEISAIFFPDASRPHVNVFQNTTPNSGLCNTFPSFCSARGLYSIRLGFEAQSQRPILANHANIRDGAMIKVPAEVRTLQVTHTSGHTVPVEFSITAFSGTHRTRNVTLITGIPTSNPNTANNHLWNGLAWGNYAAAPCTRGGALNASTIDADYFWLTPQPVPCGKAPAYDIDSMLLRNASVSYLMTTPDPLRMESGIYQGSITYTVGPGMDFDFGDVMLPTDNQVTLNFTLEVRHTLKFLFPAGDSRVVLNPTGGWQQWLNNGRRPQKLVADKSFKMWASTPFSMALQCEYPVGTQCAIQNAAGHTVPVDTRVTLPLGMQDELSRPVDRKLLSTDAQAFLPSQYVDNGLAALHFEVERDQTLGMINNHPGSTYRGNVTVIWNSEISGQ